MTDIVVGVDSGGSKTVATAGTLDGKILGRGTAGAGNPLSVGIDRSVENIVSSIKNAIAPIKYPHIVSLYIGTAGGKPQAVKDLTKAIKTSVVAPLIDHLVIDHDLRTALYSGLPNGDGIVLIVGTGSAAFGVGKDGKDVIVSGWNHWLGETGGYEMGIKAIIAATRSYDGRGEKTVFEDIIREKYGLEDYLELSYHIRAPFTDSPKIASLAPLVVDAAMNGDKVAIRIIDEMIEEMDASIRAAAKRTGIENNLKVVLVGGVFRMKLDILKKLKDKVEQWTKNPEFIFPTEEPATAAFHLALQNTRHS